MDLDNSDLHSHISKQFNMDLEDLHNRILLMGGMVEKQVRHAVDALVEMDTEKARLVQEVESQVNSLEVSLDEECTRILARRQPAASDLRMVVVVYKLITDLERIGDESNKIARMAIDLAEEGGFPKGYVQTRHIGNRVCTMVHQALDAFARFDSASALSVTREDKFVDQEYEGALRQLVTFMMEDPRSIKRVLKLVWTIRSLERIGDHARNIAEQVIYVVKGKDIRHTSADDVKELLLGD